MGWTWEVFLWLEDASGRFAYEQVYAGESALRALLAARRAKRAGVGCVKVEWR